VTLVGAVGYFIADLAILNGSFYPIPELDGALCQKQVVIVNLL